MLACADSYLQLYMVNAVLNSYTFLIYSREHLPELNAMLFKTIPKKRFLCMILILAVCGSTLFYTHVTSDTRAFRRLSKDLLQTELSGNTINLHYTLADPESFGIHQAPVLPTEISDEDQETLIRTWQQRLNRISPDKLDAGDRYAYRLFERFLALSLEDAAFAYYDEPLSPSSGMISGLPVLLADYTFRSERDVTDYLGILEQTGGYFDALVAYEKEKSAAGLFMSDASADKVIEQCDSIMDQTLLQNGEHFLQQTFTERLDELLAQGLISDRQKEQWCSENDRLLTTVMAPAYERVADAFIVLKGSGVNPYGLSYYPQGQEYYTCLLASLTGSNRSIPEIKHLLETDFSQSLNALKALIDAHPAILKLSADSSLLTFTTDTGQNAQLALTDPSLIPHSDTASGDEALLKTAEAMLQNLRTQMSQDFPSLSAATYDQEISHTIKCVSPSMESYSSPAYYLTPPIDDLTCNTVYLNTACIPDDLTLYTTLAHEGYPGHLYQTVYSQSCLNDRNDSYIRSLLHYGGFVEGWALYVENLSYGYAARLTDDPDTAAYIEACRLNRSLLLCLYSYMDIAIHYDGATPEQIEAFLTKLGLFNSFSVDAVYEYLVEEPGNYLKYYLGYLEFLSLKKNAKKLYGNSYSDYSFHQFILEAGPSDFTSLSERLALTIPVQTVY